jgi:hypothetical protein
METEGRMSGQMFAGQLCATQVGSTFGMDGSAHWWIVKQIVHTLDMPGPKVVVRSFDKTKTQVLCLNDDDLVTVGDPTQMIGQGGEIRNVYIEGDVSFGNRSRLPWSNECTIGWSYDGKPIATDAVNVCLEGHGDGAITIRPYAKRKTP